MNSIYNRIYNKLMRLVPELWVLEAGTAIKSVSEPYMDLNLDILVKEADHMVIALSHYYKHPSGDLIADPDMEIRVYKHEIAEALTYQDSYFYQEVYPDPTHYRPKLKQSLNNFLNTWLKNCLEQGHALARQ